MDAKLKIHEEIERLETHARDLRDRDHVARALETQASTYLVDHKSTHEAFAKHMRS